MTPHLTERSLRLSRKREERAMIPVEIGGACPFPYFGDTSKLYFELFVVVVFIFAGDNFDEREFDAFHHWVVGGRYVDDFEVVPIIRA